MLQFDSNNDVVTALTMPGASSAQCSVNMWERFIVTHTEPVACR